VPFDVAEREPARAITRLHATVCQAHARRSGRNSRLPSELVEAAKRFVIDFRDGHTEQIAGEMEPDLYALLEWLAQQSMLETEKRRKPEEVGREILGYRDVNTSRGVAYGALWAALVRAAAVYHRADSKTIQARNREHGCGGSPRTDRRARDPASLACDLLKPHLRSSRRPHLLRA
jgi:hypothetical protein